MRFWRRPDPHDDSLEELRDVLREQREIIEATRADVRAKTRQLEENDCCDDPDE